MLVITSVFEERPVDGLQPLLVVNDLVHERPLVGLPHRDPVEPVDNGLDRESCQDLIVGALLHLLLLLSSVFYQCLCLACPSFPQRCTNPCSYVS